MQRKSIDAKPELSSSIEAHVFWPGLHLALERSHEIAGVLRGLRFMSSRDHSEAVILSSSVAFHQLQSGDTGTP